MFDVTLLGPQRPEANLREALDALSVQGRVGAVTAGWQEGEGELDDLRDQVPNPLIDLRLYARCEDAFGEDRALFDAHRERQDGLIALQRFYRLRLSHTLAAARELAALDGPPEIVAAQRGAASTALRSLDRFHLGQIRRVHARFEQRYPLAHSRALHRQREAIAGEVAGCDAVLIAGGHVAVLLGRMRLMAFPDLVAGRPIIAWSAGAMAIADRVVLFHDHPPQGAGDPEVLDAGLGLAPGIVPLPDARRRLSLDDPRRVGIFAQRFAPARSLTLDGGAMLGFSGGRVVRCSGSMRLTGTGQVVPASAA